MSGALQAAAGFHRGATQGYASSGLPDNEAGDARSYALRLTRYIADASTVRVRTLEAFGHAPSIDLIRRFRDSHFAKNKAKAAKVQPAEIVPVEWKPAAIAMPAPEPEVAPEPDIQPGTEAPIISRTLLTATEVIDACAAFCGVSHGELIGSRRHQPIARARFLCAAALHARGSSLLAAGARLGGRDHSTVCHSIDRFFELAAHDAALLRAWKEMTPAYVHHCTSRHELTTAVMSHR